MLPDAEPYPPIIRCHVDLLWFCAWLDKHPEITNIQGWTVDRGDSGGFCGLSAPGARIGMDICELWRERAMLNDWSRAYRRRGR